jgi:hypothetical protein
MRMREGKEERKKEEMDWWKERRGTYEISVTVRLTIRASAILLTTSSPSFLFTKLRDGWERRIMNISAYKILLELSFPL